MNTPGNATAAIRRRGAYLLLCALAVVLPAAAPEAMEVPVVPGLTIVVGNLRSGEGQIRVALWNDPATFATEDTALAEADQNARPGEVRFTFPNLPPGRYAVASYHDENGNGAFDQTLIGLPDEGLGFSNGAWIGLGAPSFEEAAVEITRTQRIIAVNLRYRSGAPGPAPKQQPAGDR
jgi:uncharacterized protein (DUF2141 family)